jgi:hypothetical protein
VGPNEVGITWAVLIDRLCPCPLRIQPKYSSKSTRSETSTVAGVARDEVVERVAVGVGGCELGDVAICGRIGVAHEFAWAYVTDWHRGPRKSRRGHSAQGEGAVRLATMVYLIATILHYKSDEEWSNYEKLDRISVRCPGNESYCSRGADNRSVPG